MGSIYEERGWLWLVTIGTDDTSDADMRSPSIPVLLNVEALFDAVAGVITHRGGSRLRHTESSTSGEHRLPLRSAAEP